MTKLVRLLFVSAVLANVSSAFRQSRLRDIGNEIKKKEKKERRGESSLEDIEKKHFEQKVDHFDKSSVMKFKQRYFYSARHVKRNDKKQRSRPTYAFLCVGGEGPAMHANVLSDSDLCTGDMLELAKKMVRRAQY